MSRPSSPPEHPQVRTLVGGLGHPEGPDVGPAGAVVFVETYTGRVLRWRPDEDVEVVADCGGGPNACVLGSDGVYVTQNGGHVGGWRASESIVPSIQRIRDGRVDVVCTAASGRQLNAPNDLAWSPDGSLYFTDSGRFDPVNRPDEGSICVLRGPGEAEVLVETGRTYPNGIVVDDDARPVWVESFTGRVRRLRRDGEVETVCTLPEGHVPDGLKLGSDGALWITVTGAGGLDVVSESGEYLGFVATGGVPLNCAFDGEGGLVITDFGTFDTSGPAHMVGSLMLADVGERGQRIHRGSID